MATEDLYERLIEAERRAAAAEALLARYQERERAEAELAVQRRADAAERKRRSRATRNEVTPSHTMSHDVTVTDCDGAGQAVTPSSPLPSPSSPTPLITTSFPPSPHSPAPPAALRAPTARKSTAKYAAFPTAECDALHAEWCQRLGAVDYARFRKALGPAYQTGGTVPTLAEMQGAMQAYREAVEEMDERDASFATVEKFAGRLDHYRRRGAMPHSNEWGELTERGRVLGSKAIRDQQRAGLRVLA